MNFNIGDTIGGYEIVGVLGSGGMGEVYRVRNVISDRVDAMKVLLANLQQDSDFAMRFMREIKVQARLVHPNIAQLYTAFEQSGNLMMIMELIDGMSLLDMLQRGRIPLPQVIDYTSQALSALGYAHAQGVIHRDIKPGNIMVTHAGAVKLMDFGIAKAATDRSLTTTGNLIGSLYYMSPEQVRATAIDSRSDLYSVGVVLYQMATGKKPFEGDSEYGIMRAQVEEPPPPPTSIDPAVPEALSSVILRALAKDPADRFQTGDEFRQALEQVEGTLRQRAAGATRMFDGGVAAPRHKPTSVPTAPIGEPAWKEPAPTQAQPSGKFSNANPAADREPRQHPAEPDEAVEADGSRPRPSRTPLWIGIGVAAAVLAVAATQVFDWMTARPSSRQVASNSGQFETAANPAPPVASGNTPVPKDEPASGEELAPREAPAAAKTGPASGASSETTAEPETQQAVTAPPRTIAESPAGAAVKQPEVQRPPAPRNQEPAASTATPPPGAGRQAEAPPANPSPSAPSISASNGSQTAAIKAPVGGSSTGRQALAASSKTSVRESVASPGATENPPPSANPAATSPPPDAGAPVAERVYLPGEVDSLPQVLDRVQPRYTPAAANAKAAGTVRLQADIWPDGRAHNIRLIESAEHPDLDRNAIEALRKWAFIPGRKDGKPVKVRARIDFPFSVPTNSQRPALTKDN